MADKKQESEKKYAYSCKHCGDIVLRASGGKAWVKSFCQKTGRNTHLRLLAPKPNET